MVLLLQLWWSTGTAHRKNEYECYFRTDETSLNSIEQATCWIYGAWCHPWIIKQDQHYPGLPPGMSDWFRNTSMFHGSSPGPFGYGIDARSFCALFHVTCCLHRELPDSKLIMSGSHFFNLQPIGEPSGQGDLIVGKFPKNPTTPPIVDPDDNEGSRSGSGAEPDDSNRPTTKPTPKPPTMTPKPSTVTPKPSTVTPMPPTSFLSIMAMVSWSTMPMRGSPPVPLPKRPKA